MRREMSELGKSRHVDRSHDGVGDRLAREAEVAQRAGNWRRAAAIWREAAEAIEDAKQSEWFAKQAAWCDDMAVLVNDTDGEP